MFASSTATAQAAGFSDQGIDAREDLGPPARSGEQIVVAASARREMSLVPHGNPPAQVVRRLGLPAAGNGVQFGFDREQRGSVNVLWAHGLALNFPLANGQAEFLEHNADGIQVELSRQVQHGAVFIAQAPMCLGMLEVAANQVKVVIALRPHQTVRLGRH